jgi:hypothetical protein
MTVTPDVKPLYLHPHDAANQAVTLHGGPVTIQETGKGAAQGTGTLILRWLPSTGLRLEVDLPFGQMPEASARVKAELAGSVAETLVSHVSFENVIVVAAHGLGKTMLAKNLVHQAILAGHSARFLTASDLVLDLTGQETARALQRRLRAYVRPSVLAIDEIGYLAYDAVIEGESYRKREAERTQKSRR